jgi:hypothetical protein
MKLDRFHEDRMRGIKQLEGNRAVVSCVLFWADYLKPKADPFVQNGPPIRFSDLVILDCPVGVNDKQWLSDDPEFGKEAANPARRLGRFRTLTTCSPHEGHFS